MLLPWETCSSCKELFPHVQSELLLEWRQLHSIFLCPTIRQVSLSACQGLSCRVGIPVFSSFRERLGSTLEKTEEGSWAGVERAKQILAISYSSACSGSTTWRNICFKLAGPRAQICSVGAKVSWPEAQHTDPSCHVGVLPPEQYPLKLQHACLQFAHHHFGLLGLSWQN